MFLLLIFYIAISCAQSVVVFERYSSADCNPNSRIYPHSFPSLGGMIYAQQRTDKEYAGIFTDINNTHVAFKSPLQGTIISPINSSACFDHPAFSYGRFKLVQGPIIVSFERRTTSITDQPQSFNCVTKQARDQFLWFLNAYPDIQRTPLTTCPAVGVTVFLIQNGNIASMKIGTTTAAKQSGNGCFDNSDPIVQACNPQNHQRYCVADTSCSATDLSSLRLDPFRDPNSGVVESIRIVSNNVFPFSQTATTSMTTTATVAPTTSDAWANVPVSFWFILIITIIKYI